MNTSDRILTFADIMLTKCERNPKDYDYKLYLNKFYSDNDNVYDDVYELRIVATDNDDFLSSHVDLLIEFCFGGSVTLPYISLSFTDDYQESVKVHQDVVIERFRNRVVKLYEESMESQFNNILKKTMDWFDIDQSEIREAKINNLIDYE